MNTKLNSESKVLSHSIETLNLEESVETIRQRLKATGDTALGALDEKLKLLNELTEFELGRFLLLNGGLNGRWSHYVFYEFPLLPEPLRPKHPLELRLLNQWRWNSARDRLLMTKKILDQKICNQTKLMSLPCGVMAEALSLDVVKKSNCHLFGVDLDENSLELARKFSIEQGVEDKVKFFLRDAWNHGFNSEFDIVLSLGLSIYSPTLEIAMDLYRSLYKAVKTGGCLIIQFSTPPSGPDSERNVSSVSQEEVRFSDLITREIVQFKLRHFNTSQQIVERLKNVGFQKVELFHNSYRTTNIALAEK